MSDPQAHQLESYTEHDIEYRHMPTPEDWVEIDRFDVPQSLHPWDYYGHTHVAEIRSVLQAAGIESQRLITHRRKLGAIGTGPGKRLRFGDDMLPGIYRVAVPQSQQGAATLALLAHKDAVDNWLYSGQAMPEACRT